PKCGGESVNILITRLAIRNYRIFRIHATWSVSVFQQFFEGIVTSTFRMLMKLNPGSGLARYIRPDIKIFPGGTKIYTESNLWYTRFVNSNHIRFGDDAVTVNILIL